jgi:hypothetical protein
MGYTFELLSAAQCFQLHDSSQGSQVSPFNNALQRGF